MPKKREVLLFSFFFFISTLLTGCAGKQAVSGSPHLSVIADNGKENNINILMDNKSIEAIIDKYKNKQPRQWGEKVSGVKQKLDTKDMVIALTFDACGGAGGDGYDSELIKFLEEEKIKATLFINSRWIDANYDKFMALSKNPLFEIENHGFKHRPLSVNGKSAYGIKGTKNVKDVIDEVLLNEQKIKRLTGRRPKYFRSGTAYYDEVAVKIANDLGEEVVNFSVLGDAGATYTKEEVREACLSATPGSIIICHMNHPEKDTAEGIRMAIPELEKRGFRFVKLEDYTLK